MRGRNSALDPALDPAPEPGALRSRAGGQRHGTGCGFREFPGFGGADGGV